ncbi:hypothetical protein [Fibrobacter sp.]|uniref:hypothetical protein n=1 Tax=Fibrobacter sp. TaxID=35828 RepID=UPI00386DAD44
MIEYDLFIQMLSESFLSPNQQKMEEPKQAGNHTCKIVDKGVDNYKAYRYDLEEHNFLPFFNREHTAVNNTPTGLLKFCDYILLATVNQKLYVILVEMKSGVTTGANQQLAASKTFIDYVIASAERIKTMSGYNNFNAKNIIFRKVLLKPAPKTRPLTNIRKKNSQINWGADPIVLNSQLFPLLQVCECRQR